MTFTRSEKYVIAGCEMGSVTVTSTISGKLVANLERHRGMVTAVKVNAGDDVFATAATDGSIMIWSLDKHFPLLNSMQLPKPIFYIDISPDSTFIIAACDDNRVHVRALTTGSDVHQLEKHPNNSLITHLKFAEDR